MSPNKNQPGQTRSQKSKITPTFLSMPQNMIADELRKDAASSPMPQQSGPIKNIGPENIRRSSLVSKKVIKL